MRSPREYVRSLDPGLPRDVWLLQAGGLLNAFGNGVVLPFLIIYLHNARGVPLGLAGLIAATNSAAALVTGFVAGSLADRIGPRQVLIGALCVMTAAIALLTAPVTRCWSEAPATVTVGPSRNGEPVGAASSPGFMPAGMGLRPSIWSRSSPAAAEAV